MHNARSKSTQRSSKGESLSPEQKAQIRQMVNSKLSSNIERKYITALTNTSSISYTGSVYNVLSNAVLGDGAINAYTGVVLKPTRVTLRYRVSSNQSYSALRVILFQWRESGVPSTAGILTTTGSVLAPFSPLLYLNRPLIHVLHDELHCLFQRDAASYASECKTVDIKTGLLSIHMNPATAPVPQKNGIYLLCISDDAAVSYPVLDFYSDVEFTDA